MKSKKINCPLFIIAFILLSFTACASNSAIGDQMAAPYDELEDGKDNVGLEAVLPGMPVDFVLMSGVGGWRTLVTIEADGTFSGYYSDMEKGAVGDGYPNGTRLESYFSGKFSNIQKVSDHEYSMTTETITLQNGRKTGDEYISEGIFVITAEPYGFTESSEYILYMPGRSTADLPKEYLSWVGTANAWSPDGTPATLPFYGLYDMDGKFGFYSN